ncbi:MAG: hypothetical protein VX886_04240 [Pseudomonadota bacterium]|nr:hypothetical protein [Pseudomonadota bacterium]
MSPRWVLSLLLVGGVGQANEPIDALSAAGVDPMQARLNYMLNCQGCHAVDGRGLNDIPTMADFVGKFLTVDGGRAYLVQVPGSANSPLSDQQLAEVLNWVLLTMSQPQLPQPFEPYTAAEVNDYRKQTMSDAAAVRRDLLAQLKVQ